MNSSDLEYCQAYLIDLMRAYGHRPITVKLDNNGEPVEVMACNFIKRQLTKVGILFPYNAIAGITKPIAKTDVRNSFLFMDILSLYLCEYYIKNDHPTQKKTSKNNGLYTKNTAQMGGVLLFNYFARLLYQTKILSFVLIRHR